MRRLALGASWGARRVVGRSARRGALGASLGRPARRWGARRVRQRPAARRIEAPDRTSATGRVGDSVQHMYNSPQAWLAVELGLGALGALAADQRNGSIEEERDRPGAGSARLAAGTACRELETAPFAAGTACRGPNRPISGPKPALTFVSDHGFGRFRTLWSISRRFRANRRRRSARAATAPSRAPFVAAVLAGRTPGLTAGRAPPVARPG